MAYIGPPPSQKVATPTSQYFSGNGSATAFTLNRPVNVSEDLNVFVNNVPQEPGSGKSYTATGTTLTFDAAPSSGTNNVYVVYRGLSEGTLRLEQDPNAGITATQLTLKSTDAGAGSGPIIDLTRDSASPADSDFLGEVRFKFDNDASEETVGVKFKTQLIDASDGTEDAAFYIDTMVAGTERNRMLISPTTTVFNDDSVDVDFRVESNDVTHALFVDAGNNRIGINCDSPLNTDLQVGTNSGQIAMGENASGNGACRLKFQGSDTQKAWQISTNDNVGGALEFTQSTAAGGTTYSSTPAVVISSAGNVGINQVGPSFPLTINGTASNHAGAVTIATNGYSAFLFYNSSGGHVGNIAINASSTSYYTSSDYRLKTDVTYDWDATSRLKQLKPARFKWISEGDDAVYVDGFLAHEAATAVPESVSGTKDGMKDEEYEVSPEERDADGTITKEAVMGTRSVPDYQGIDQAKLVPLLVKTIQELEARITALES